MALNRSQDTGVKRATDADITVYPTVTDIGVPVSFALVAADHRQNRMTNTRAATHPNTRGLSVRGVAVPLNPETGVISS